MTDWVNENPSLRFSGIIEGEKLFTLDTTVWIKYVSEANTEEAREEN